jgi:hypothetical protein
MVETEIIVHNMTEIKVLAQIYAGRTLVSTCVVDPGGTGPLSAKSIRFDVFFKNGATGWEIARKLNSDARDITLNHDRHGYTIQEANHNESLASAV